jgi:MFS family permease
MTGSRRDLIAWPIGISLLTSTMAAPLLGRAGETYGRRNVLQLSLVGVLVTGLLSGLAPTMSVLITCRALFGIASGGLLAVSAAAVPEVVPRSPYARFQGQSLAATSIASIVAPLVSGLIVSPSPAQMDS